MKETKSVSLGPAGSAPDGGLGSLVFGIVLAMWANGLVAVFAQNRIIIASWFVLTHLAFPLTFFVAGSTFQALISRTDRLPVRRLVLRHIWMLILVCVALPIPLGVLNLLPFGQTTSLWRGSVAVVPPLEMMGLPGSLLIVDADRIGPHLRVRVSGDEYSAVAGAPDLSQLPMVEGWVVRGFLGVPVDCRWKGFVLEPVPAR